jgi:hypothetical protein
MTDSLIWRSLEPVKKRMVQENSNRELPIEWDICQPFAETNQSFEPHFFGDSTAGLIDSLHALFPAVLHYLQEV